LIIGECFGQVSFGTVFGLAGLFISSLSSFGPMIAGFIYVVHQNNGRGTDLAKLQLGRCLQGEMGHHRIEIAIVMK
jgi:hypothetical protein